MSNKYLDIAMGKVIRQEVNAVLDKIRAEIEERKLNSGGEPNRDIAFNVCLQIIDKYKTGSGGNEYGRY